MSTESHLPIDQSVIIPAAVRNAGAAADALMAATAPPPPTGGPPPPAGLEHVVVIPTGGPPPPAGFTQQPVFQPQQPPVFQQSGQPQEPAPAQPGSPEAQWERRAKSYRGQLDVERTRFTREIEGLRGQVNDLVRQLQGGGLTPAGNPVPTDLANILPADKRAEFEKTWGKEMTDTMVEIAGTIAGASAARVGAQVGQRIESSEAQHAQFAWTTMVAALDWMLPGGNGMPDWKIINDDPDFEIWLQAADGFSNMSRHDVLRQAWAANNTQQVYSIFAAYMAGLQPTPVGAGPGPTTPVPLNGAPQPSARLPMHNLAAPGPARPASSGQSGAQEPNYYTTSHIAKFFQDKARGLYNDTQARTQWAAGIEADIFAAQKEGRVMQG